MLVSTNLYHHCPKLGWVAIVFWHKHSHAEIKVPYMRNTSLILKLASLITCCPMFSWAVAANQAVDAGISWSLPALDQPASGLTRRGDQSLGDRTHIWNMSQALYTIFHIGPFWTAIKEITHFPYQAEWKSDPLEPWVVFWNLGWVVFWNHGKLNKVDISNHHDGVKYQPQHNMRWLAFLQPL